MQYHVLDNFILNTAKFGSYFSEAKNIFKLIYITALNQQLNKTKKEKERQAGSGQAEPDLGQIQPSQLAGQPGVKGEAVRGYGRRIRRRSTAVRRRCRELLHAREKARRWLGFCGRGAYRGRRGQSRVGIGRGKVGEDGGSCRACMQG
jgi:hypothetical protein